MTSDVHERPTEGDEDSRARRLLSRMQRINAPADFVVRLQRRLAEERRRRQGRSVRMPAIVPFRVPIYAGSIIAIVGLSVVAYYALIRTGVTPEEFSGPKQQIEAPAFGDSLLMEKRAVPADRDDAPAELEERSSRMYPRGEKAPSVLFSRERKEAGAKSDLKKIGDLELAAPLEGKRYNAEDVQKNELDSTDMKQDSIRRAAESEQQPPQEHE